MDFEDVVWKWLLFLCVS